MIPYFKFTVMYLGPIPIQVWGTMVALGILAGAWAAAWLAQRRGLRKEIVWDTTTWTILGSLVMARLFHVIYEPAVYLANPVQIFRIWEGGMSIIGGFIGAVLVAIWYLRRQRVDVWAYADTMLFGLPLGLFIGRIGCFLIHDHPGTLTDFTLGVQYPDGVRHDHGLYLSINGLILFLVFVWMLRRRVAQGWFIIVFLIWYGVVRFGLDFLRARDGLIVDTRYLSLTPAQYGSILMVIIGVWIWIKKRPLKQPS